MKFGGNVRRTYIDGQPQLACQFWAECILPFDRYTSRKVAETSPSGRLASLYPPRSLRRSETADISTQNFVDFEMTVWATFLSYFVPVQRRVQICQLSDRPQTWRQLSPPHNYLLLTLHWLVHLQMNIKSLGAKTCQRLPETWNVIVIWFHITSASQKIGISKSESLELKVSQLHTFCL